DVWALSLDRVGWRQLPMLGLTRDGRLGHSLTYDPVGDRVILYGGLAADPVSNPRDVWQFFPGGLAVWAQLQAQGEGAEVRWGQVPLYDPARRRLIVVGGDGRPSAGTDTWQLSLDGPPAWTRIVGARALPAERVDASAVVDGARHRLVVFGGFSTTE